jgi:hypothetical protein
MTGPAEGKLPLIARVYVNEDELEDAHVYVHLKGFSRATVTHLDIEHPSLSGLIPPKVRTFIWIVGVEDGILIRTEKNDTVNVLCPLLTEVLQRSEKTKTCVGGKFNGMFIGFRKRELIKLEAIAEDLRIKRTIP